jgi:hypothetical protein
MTKRFIDFIQNKDAASFQEAFEEVVSQKVYAVLEAAKKEVAQDMFNEGGFTGVVTHGNVTKGWPAPPKAGASKLPEEMCKHCGKDPCECKEEEEEMHMETVVVYPPKQPKQPKRPKPRDTTPLKLEKADHLDEISLGTAARAYDDMRGTASDYPRNPEDIKRANRMANRISRLHGTKGKAAVSRIDRKYNEDTEHLDEISLGTATRAYDDMRGTASDYPRNPEDIKRANRMANRISRLHGSKGKAAVSRIDRKYNENYYPEQVDKNKLHHKMTKKMMKLAHKHSKKHHEEEE